MSEQVLKGEVTGPLPVREKERHRGPLALLDGSVQSQLEEPLGEEDRQGPGEVRGPLPVREKERHRGPLALLDGSVQSQLEELLGEGPDKV